MKTAFAVFAAQVCCGDLIDYHEIQFLLLLFQDLTKEHTDHVIIELTNGSVHFSLNTGLDTATATLGRGLNDGAWHLMTVQISGSQATISIDQGSCIGQDCSKSVSTSSDGTPQFSGLPYLGGVSKLVPRIKQELTTDGTFVGCIKVCIVGNISIT